MRGAGTSITALLFAHICFVNNIFQAIHHLLISTMNELTSNAQETINKPTTQAQSTPNELAISAQRTTNEPITNAQGTMNEPTMNARGTTDELSTIDEGTLDERTTNALVMMEFDRGSCPLACIQCLGNICVSYLTASPSLTSVANRNFANDELCIRTMGKLCDLVKALRMDEI